MTSRLKGLVMNYADLTPELLEKAKACKTTEELVALAKSEGVELSDEQLETVSGGSWSGSHKGCDSFSCAGWDCAVFGCNTVNCTGMDCSIY